MTLPEEVESLLSGIKSAPFQGEVTIRGLTLTVSVVREDTGFAPYVGSWNGEPRKAVKSAVNGIRSRLTFLLNDPGFGTFVPVMTGAEMEARMALKELNLRKKLGR